MKFRFLYAVICSAAILSSSTARGTEVAVGFVLGEPTGFSVRIERFPVLSFGWSLSYDWMYVNGDYWLIHKPLPNASPLDWYLGVGGALGLGGSQAFLGARLPIGLQMIFDRKFELFGEIAPVLGLIPDVGLFFNGGIGLRYIF